MNVFKVFKVGQLYYYFEEEDYDPSDPPKDNKAEFILYRIVKKTLSEYYYETICSFNAHRNNSAMDRDSYMVRVSKPWTYKYLKDDFYYIISYLFEEKRPRGLLDLRGKKSR